MKVNLSLTEKRISNLSYLPLTKTTIIMMINNEYQIPKEELKPNLHKYLEKSNKHKPLSLHSQLSDFVPHLKCGFKL